MLSIGVVVVVSPAASQKLIKRCIGIQDLIYKQKTDNDQQAKKYKNRNPFVERSNAELTANQLSANTAAILMLPIPSPEAAAPFSCRLLLPTTPPDSSIEAWLP